MSDLFWIFAILIHNADALPVTSTVPSLEYKPTRPFYHPNPGPFIPQIVPSGDPWPANLDGYANFSQTTKPLTQNSLENQFNGTIANNSVPVTLEDRFPETITNSGRPPFHPNPGNNVGQIVPPGDPWPGNLEGYANFSQTTKPFTQNSIEIQDKIREMLAEIITSVESNNSQISSSSKPETDSNNVTITLEDRFPETTTYSGRPPFHPNPGNNVGQIVPPGDPWPANLEGYANFSQTTKPLTQNSIRNRVEIEETTTQSTPVTLSNILQLPNVKIEEKFKENVTASPLLQIFPSGASINSQISSSSIIPANFIQTSTSASVNVQRRSLNDDGAEENQPNEVENFSSNSPEMTNNESDDSQLAEDRSKSSKKDLSLSQFVPDVNKMNYSRNFDDNDEKTISEKIRQEELSESVAENAPKNDAENPLGYIRSRNDRKKSAKDSKVVETKITFHIGKEDLDIPVKNKNDAVEMDTKITNKPQVKDGLPKTVPENTNSFENLGNMENSNSPKGIILLDKDLDIPVKNKNDAVEKDNKNTNKPQVNDGLPKTVPEHKNPFENMENYNAPEEKIVILKDLDIPDKNIKDAVEKDNKNKPQVKDGLPKTVPENKNTFENMENYNIPKDKIVILKDLDIPVKNKNDAVEKDNKNKPQVKDGLPKTVPENKNTFENVENYNIPKDKIVILKDLDIPVKNKNDAVEKDNKNKPQVKDGLPKTVFENKNPFANLGNMGNFNIAKRMFNEDSSSGDPDSPAAFVQVFHKNSNDLLNQMVKETEYLKAHQKLIKKTLPPKHKLMVIYTYYPALGFSSNFPFY